MGCKGYGNTSFPVVEPATYSIHRIHSTDLKTRLIKRTFSKIFSQNMEESSWPPILDFLELSVTWKSDRSERIFVYLEYLRWDDLISKVFSRSKYLLNSKLNQLRISVPWVGFSKFSCACLNQNIVHLDPEYFVVFVKILFLFDQII